MQRVHSPHALEPLHGAGQQEEVCDAQRGAADVAVAVHAVLGDRLGESASEQ